LKEGVLVDKIEDLFENIKQEESKNKELTKDKTDMHKVVRSDA